MADYKVGDRVKVTLEGEVANARDYGEVVELRVSSNGLDNYVYTDSATIEKVDLPVEVFEPGDVVRHRRTGNVRALADKGYVDSDGRWRAYSDPETRWRPEEFNSMWFERVDLS